MNQTWKNEQVRQKREKGQTSKPRLIFLRGNSTQRELEDRFAQELRRGRLTSGRSRQSTCEQSHKHKPPWESTGLSPHSHAFPSAKSFPGELTPSEAPTPPAQDLHFLWDYYLFKQQNDKIASCSGSLNHSSHC